MIVRAHEDHTAPYLSDARRSRRLSLPPPLVVLLLAVTSLVSLRIGVKHYVATRLALLAVVIRLVFLGIMRM